MQIYNYFFFFCYQRCNLLYKRRESLEIVIEISSKNVFGKFNLLTKKELVSLAFSPLAPNHSGITLKLSMPAYVLSQMLVAIYLVLFCLINKLRCRFIPGCIIHDDNLLCRTMNCCNIRLIVEDFCCRTGLQLKFTIRIQ